MSNTENIQPCTGDVNAAVDMGMITAEVRYVDGVPFVALPAGSKVHNLEAMLAQPTRARGKVALRDQKSFCEYVNQRNSPVLRVYGVEAPKPGFVAVLNDHGQDDQSAGWRDDVATFDCPLSREWVIWTGTSGKSMAQDVFAQFIEDNLPDIADPAGADMLEISRTLEAKKKVNFASGIRLSNGEHQLTYEETIQGTAAKGRIVVPETFVLGIPVFEGGDRYRVDARLRYRIDAGGSMAMWFDLLRAHKVLEDATRYVWRAIEEELGVTVLNGGIVS